MATPKKRRGQKVIQRLAGTGYFPHLEGAALLEEGWSEEKKEGPSNRGGPSARVHDKKVTLGEDDMSKTNFLNKTARGGEKRPDLDSTKTNDSSVTAPGLRPARRCKATGNEGREGNRKNPAEGKEGSSSRKFTPRHQEPQTSNSGRSHPRPCTRRKGKNPVLPNLGHNNFSPPGRTASLEKVWRVENRFSAVLLWYGG